MTIYSQHPNRGRVQILATHSRKEALHSITVTSVENSESARPIVDALNRISACLTVPMSVWDTRNDGIERYPYSHLDAAADRTRRSDLLTGAHSLWYEYVKLVLHEALEDLDTAMGDVPAPVRTAIDAEISTEISQLHGALAEYEGDSTDTEMHRHLESDLPTVLFEGGLHELKSETREMMNLAEARQFEGALEEANNGLRLLFEAHARCSNSSADFEPTGPGIFVEPFDQSDFHGYFLSVDTPGNFKNGGRGWQITISKWVPDSDDDEDEDSESATGESIVVCVLPSAPPVSELVDLIDNVGETDERQLLEWSKTSVGEVLAGTRFTVTERPISES